MALSHFLFLTLNCDCISFRNLAVLGRSCPPTPASSRACPREGLPTHPGSSRACPSVPGQHIRGSVKPGGSPAPSPGCLCRWRSVLLLRRRGARGEQGVAGSRPGWTEPWLCSLQLCGRGVPRGKEPDAVSYLPRALPSYCEVLRREAAVKPGSVAQPRVRRARAAAPHSPQRCLVPLSTGARGNQTRHHATVQTGAVAPI